MRFDQLPGFESTIHLAQWLGLAMGEIDWFADRYNNLARNHVEQSHHYRWHWLPKRRGGVRMIEAPKARLRRVQRRILDRILHLVPLSEAACGFVRGRSCLDHARRHVGAIWLVTTDLSDWFGRIDGARVFAQFRWLGYPPAVAVALTGLCTTRVPAALIAQAAPGDRLWLRSPHLPQGAPTSPSLANLVTSRLDRRLSAYAAAENLRYSRYADDLALSPQHGANAPPPDRVIDAVTRIARSERFVINTAKTHIRRQCDSMRICGSIVNARLNSTRVEYDRLRAAVHRHVHGNPEPDLNKLLGQLTWLAQRNPRRAERLREKLKREAGPGSDELEPQIDRLTCSSANNG